MNILMQILTDPVIDKYSSDAYDALLKCIPNASNHTSGRIGDGTATHTPLKQAEYPQVKFWFKHDWTVYQSEHPADLDADGKTQRGKGRASKGVNVTMCYVEHDDGQTVNGNRASEIRRFARSIWVLLAKKGTVPATWGAADLESRKLYCHEMSDRFPELGLCDLDWKAEQVVTDNYPSWHSTYKSKQLQNDIKQERAATPTPHSGLQVKRSSGEPAMTSLKRVKVQAIPDGSKDVEINKTPMTTNLTPKANTTANDGVMVSPVYYYWLRPLKR